MALFNNFPYTDLNDINLDYTLQKLESLYTRGEQLYSTLTTWQQATDAELEQWKAATESSLALWKTQTENSIDNKIQLLTAAINTAFTELRTQLEAHIAEIETTAVNAASDASASATAAAGAASAASINNEQSKEWAIGETLEGDPVPDTNPAYENNAKYYADLLGQETEQIDQNTADITDLKSAINYNDSKTQSAIMESIGLTGVMTFAGGIHSSGTKFSSFTTSRSAAIDVKPNDIISFKTNSSILIEFASAYTKPGEVTAEGSITGVKASGQNDYRIGCTNLTDYTFTVPATANYLIMELVSSNSDRTPSTFYINGIDYKAKIRSEISTINTAISNQNQAISDLETFCENDKTDPTSHAMVYEAVEDYEVCGLLDFQNDLFYGSTGGKKYDVSEMSAICVSGATSAVAATRNYNLYGFYTDGGTFISAYDGEGYTAYTDVEASVPATAKYCYVNGDATHPATLKTVVYKNIANYINENSTPSIWKNKKIGVLGTSVAFGANATTSYSYKASQLLNFDLTMFATPGLAIETASDGTPKQYGSFTCSKSEYTSAGWTIPDSPVTPYVPGGTYNNYYKTYENVFTAANADIDLWVYAVVPNNTEFGLDDWNAFNKAEWRYNDNSAFLSHRKTFIGALLFIMNQMYTLNPDARMVFVMDSTFAYSDGLEALQTVASEWQIPIINLWGKINICPPSLTKLKSLNGTDNHPSTFAHEIMGKMFAGELGLIS